MRFIGKSSMILAGVILMLHTMLPHNHHDELSEEEHFEVHEDAVSIIDYIKLAFHVDQGNNHLEDFKNSQQVQIQFLAIETDLIITFESVIVEEITERRTNYLANFQTRFRISDLSFRGPPNKG